MKKTFFTFLVLFTSLSAWSNQEIEIEQYLGDYSIEESDCYFQVQEAGSMSSPFFVDCSVDEAKIDRGQSMYDKGLVVELRNAGEVIEQIDFRNFRMEFMAPAGVYPNAFKATASNMMGDLMGSSTKSDAGISKFVTSANLVRMLDGSLSLEYMFTSFFGSKPYERKLIFLKLKKK